MDSGEAFKKRGNVFFSRKEFSKAIEAYGDAIDAPVSYRRLFDEAPRRATYHANRAAAYLARGDAPDAGTTCFDANGHLENRVFLFDRGSPDAETRRIEKNEKEKETYAASVRAHAEAALLDCDAALEMQSGHIKARFRRAVALWRLGRADEARRDAEKAVLAASTTAEEREASALLRTLQSPYVHSSQTRSASERARRADAEGVARNAARREDAGTGTGTGMGTGTGTGMGTEEPLEKGTEWSAADAFRATTADREKAESTETSAAREKRRTVSVYGSAIGTSGSATAIDAVTALGGEGDELYDLD